MSTKRRTREELERDLQAERESRTNLQARARDADQAMGQLCTRLDDLKERLAFAEAETQRMRGYIARVQEDDVVREELITTGDPEGQQQLVPKRKHTSMPDFVPREGGMHLDGRHGVYSANCVVGDPRPRHWVTY